MVTVVTAFIIQRHQKEVGAVQIFQGLLTGLKWRVQNCVRQRPAHPLQDGSLYQEGLNVIWQAAQYLFKQIIDHEALASAEVVNKILSVHAPLQRQCSHLQPGNPAFGSLR